MACCCPINLTLHYCAVWIVTRAMQINNDSSISNITNRPAFLQLNSQKEAKVCGFLTKKKRKTPLFSQMPCFEGACNILHSRHGWFVIKYHCLNNKWDLGHSLAHLLAQVPQSASTPAGLSSSLDTLPHVTPDSLFLLLPHFLLVMSTKDLKPNSLWKSLAFFPAAEWVFGMTVA